MPRPPKFTVRLSLRLKILFILVSLPLVSLGLYLAMATDLFKSDKLAYVYDSSAAVSRGLASQLRLESQNAYANLRAIVDDVDVAQKKVGPTGQTLFERNPRIRALTLGRAAGAGRFAEVVRLVKDDAGARAFAGDAGALQSLSGRADRDQVLVRENPAAPGFVELGYRLGEAGDPRRLVVVALYAADELISAFRADGLYGSVVLTRAGDVALNAIDLVGSDQAVLQATLPKAGLAREGTAEARLSDGQTYLVSFADVGAGGLVAVSKVNKQKALKAVDVLIEKSGLFFVALLASTLIVSVVVSGRLTATLLELFEATRKIALGDFNVKVVPRSRDEVGGLALSFNHMAAEVQRLLVDTAEQARMAGELSTVRTVQETLFPPASSRFGPIHVAGHFEPASECGGDWWSYSRVGNRLFVWIGDATGHGAPAALITSAATSAAAVIETLPDLTPALAMSTLNRAILQTSKGQIMMTFFIACIDLDRRTFTFSNASHDPPYLLRRTAGALTKKDLRPLNDVNGPRLGEQKNHVYAEASAEFGPGDLLVLYTDGALDVEDPAGTKIGERNFLKHVVASANLAGPVEGKLGRLRGELDGFRKHATLIDDVTLVMCQYDPVGA